MTTDISSARTADLGYSANFLGQQVAPPTIDDALLDDTVLLDGSEIVPYTHFSLALSKMLSVSRLD